MPPPNPAPRPASLDGCWSDWSEQDQPVTIRSEMESGLVKTRRRFTGRTRRAQVGVVLRAEFYDDFINWFVQDCEQGIRSTNMKDPLGVESPWRFVSPPQIRWDTANNKYFRAFCEIEKLPGW